MAVYIWQDNAFDKMVEVEGESWQQQQKEGLFGNNAFEIFLKQYSELAAAIPNFKEMPEFAITIADEKGATDSVIYGGGGWSRYVVLNTGEICFIKLMAPSKEKAEMAERVGFRMW